MKKRLFTFGCSYSQYVWPMWPAILGQSFDYTENYGKSGAGNLFLFYRLIYAITSRTLTENDTVVIQWSGPSRYDYLRKDDDFWHNGGDQTNIEFVKANLGHLNSDNLSILKSLTFMNAAAELLSKTPAKWYFIYLNEYCMVHKENIFEKYETEISNYQIKYEIEHFQENIKNKYSSHIIDSTGIYEHVMKIYGPQPWPLWQQEEGDPGFRDSHPLPTQTLSYIKAELMDKIQGLDLLAMDRYSEYTEKLVLQNVIGTNAEGNFIFRPKTFHHIFEDLHKRNHETGFRPVASGYYYAKEEQ